MVNHLASPRRRGVAIHPPSAVRGRNEGDMLNFRKNLLVEGAGGPVALQTSCAREKSEVG